APHALHMPSHIFTRVGAWADSVATNRRSADAAQKSNDPDDALHALDYMTYAYLQLSRDGDARKVLDEARTLDGNQPGACDRVLRARRDAGPLRRRARRLERCAEARRQPEQLSIHRGDDALRAHARRGEEWRSRRGAEGRRADHIFA